MCKRSQVEPRQPQKVVYAQQPKMIKSTGLDFSKHLTSSMKTVALEKNSLAESGVGNCDAAGWSCCGDLVICLFKILATK